MERPRVDGNQFVLRGERRPLLFFSAFSTMAFLSNWARGQGGAWLDRVESYLERVKEQGADGVRVFGETTDWIDHRFFNKFRATDRSIWSYGDLWAGNRPTQLSALNAQIIAKFIQLLHKHELVGEYVVDATMKHSVEPIRWGTIGHCIRQTANFLWCIENQKLPDGFSSWPDHVKDQVTAIIEREVPFLFELHNEWDAHAKESWDADGMTRAQALSELNQQFRRLRRLKDGVPEQWPAAVASVSHGGNDVVEYDGDRVDYVAIHPERGGDWSAIGSRFRPNERFGRPIYLNETKHYIDPDWWWTIDQGWFNNGSSTKDHERLLRMKEDAFAAGYSFCIHSLVGMANGIWEGRLNEPMPLSPLELELRGAGVPPPPPPSDPEPEPEPPPPPPPPSPKDPVELSVSGPDANGVVSMRFTFTGWPRVVPGIVAEDAVQERHVVKLPQTYRVYAATAYIATDRGDIGEYALEVGSINGPEMYQESRHKEAPVNYDGWTTPRYVAMNGVTTDEVQIWITARTAGANDILRKGQPWSSRPHFGLVMWGIADTPLPSSPPPPPPPPSEEKKATDYVPWADREDWARKIELAYSTWRGARDLEALLAAPQFLLGGARQLVDISASHLSAIIRGMVAVDKKGQTLAFRVRTEKHREFDDRSQVRKSVVHEMVSDLETQTAIYSKIAAKFPREAVGCDSIACTIGRL